ncbi:hypothetical protein, partial [Bailinhaonella thermotolerans]|uniref:hypothetical protein n=1 Tax=Bailinhaonella thermotolerans TaxID=1070861 RepID=UPI001A8BF928
MDGLERWPIDPVWCPGWPADPADYTAAQAAAADVATELLWRLTAGRYGLRTDTVRPCRRGCLDGGAVADGGWMRPVLLGARWVNMGGCTCIGTCGCGPVCEVELPGPVYSITTVRVDGAVVDPADYTVQDGRWLIRREGPCWPLCQDIARPDTEPGTWSVTYRRGRPVPPAGVRAVSTLACELHKATGAAGGQRCRLPSRVQEIVRDGITMTLIDPMEWL